MKALFLDRDGTINVDYGYVHEPSRFVFIDGIFDICHQARDHGYAIIVVTNQSGIARGYFTEDDYQALTRHMVDAFAREGVEITDVLHCPSLDGPDRKPNPGLFLKARDRHGIDMAASISIGDKPRDLQAAEAAGVGTNLLFTGDYSALRIPWADARPPSPPPSAALRESLLRAVRFLHRHTSCLNGLKRRLGLERLAVSMATPRPGSKELASIVRDANTSFVRDQIEALRARGVEAPDVYVLAAEAMGDVLSCEPVGRAVKELAPNCRIHWIVRKPFREIIEAAPFVDELIAVDSLAEGFDLFLERTRDGAAVAVNCHMDGVACTKTGRVVRNPCNPRVNFLTYYNLGTLLNAFSLCAGLPRLEEASIFHFAPGVSSPFTDMGAYVVVHCRSTDPNRDWTDVKWNRLAEHLLAQGLGVVEIGMPKTIRSDAPRYVDFTGRRSLQQVARVIEGARLFIGVDSGFAHVACAVKTPGIVLLGRYAHYDTYMPYSGTFAHGPRFRVLHAAASEPAASLPLEEAVAAVGEFIGEQANDQSAQDQS